MTSLTSTTTGTSAVSEHVLATYFAQNPSDQAKLDLVTLDIADMVGLPLDKCIADKRQQLFCAAARSKGISIAELAASYTTES